LDDGDEIPMLWASGVGPLGSSRVHHGRLRRYRPYRESPVNRPAYWQQELMRENIILRRRLDEAGLGKVVLSSVAIERYVFLTAYVMRKLKEAGALTEDVTKSMWPVMRYPMTDPVPPRAWFLLSEDGQTWRQPLDQHYDLGEGRPEKMEFDHICNRLIHHFAFDVRVGGNGIGEILFNSDHTTNRLWSITLDRYMGLVDEVAHDETMWIDTDRTRKDNPVIRRRQRRGSRLHVDDAAD
jgi:hypothetical protein